jgi:hypothetical protein
VSMSDTVDHRLLATAMPLFVGFSFSIVQLVADTALSTSSGAFFLYHIDVRLQMLYYYLVPSLARRLL